MEDLTKKEKILKRVRKKQKKANDFKNKTTTTTKVAKTPEEEWAKFKQVDDLLCTVNEYMAIYSRLQETGKLIIISLEGDKKPLYDLLSGYDDKLWYDNTLLDDEQQYELMVRQAELTLIKMENLASQIQSKLSVEYWQGPLKGKGQIKQKRDNDYDGKI